jgi:hypothetical protein
MMKRRAFFRRMLGSLGVAVTVPSVAGAGRSVLIQESPIAGFQFHEGEAIWPALTVGKELTLIREPDNEHDPDAVAIYLGNDKLGYVPRAENGVVANMLDRGETMDASICRLMLDEDPWQRVRFRVYLR